MEDWLKFIFGTAITLLLGAFGFVHRRVTRLEDRTEAKILRALDETDRKIDRVMEDRDKERDRIWEAITRQSSAIKDLTGKVLADYPTKADMKDMETRITETIKATLGRP